MTTLFENEDFILKLTGHDYDFVGIIETKGDKPLTFFFSEELHEETVEETDGMTEVEVEVNEDETRLLDVYKGLKEYDGNVDEEEETAMWIGADSWLRTRDDKSTGFLSEPRERGQFLALVKNYCPERLKDIKWATM